MLFEWDEKKDQANIRKHGVDFALACRIFEGVVFTAIDSRQDYGELRKVSIGMVDRVAILVVVHTDREGRTRLISARPASRRERRRYEQELRQAHDHR